MPLTPKHTIKDSVFTDLFQDKKYLLQLYKTLHPEDEDVTEDDIKNVTLKSVLVGAEYNDLGFSVGDRLVILAESQSTWSENILIRALLYLSQTYHDYFKQTEQNLYGSKKVRLPKPELYVIFTGDRPEKPPEYISLSEDFFDGEKIAVDAKVKVLYQEDESNIIGEYIIFCKVYNEQRKKCGQTKEAIEETIRICKDRNVLREYLENRQKEVVDIMMTLYDDEEILEMYTIDIERKAAERVAKEHDRKAVEYMIKTGKLTLEEIAEGFPSLSLDEIKEIEAEIMQMA